MNSRFKNISVRARTAFAILCLENALKKTDEDLLWKKVLSVLWLITSIRYVDEWLYKVSHIMPSSVLEDSYEENEELTFDEHNKLKSLYLKTPQFIFDILEKIFECGTIELYGKIVDYSPRTLKVLDELVFLMKRENIVLPNLNPLEELPISENEGWGRVFTREEIVNEGNS